MAVGDARPEPLASQRPSTQPGHVGGCSGLVEEDQPFWIKIKLALKPRLAPLQDIGAVLLQRMCGLFFTVMLQASGASALPTTEEELETANKVIDELGKIRSGQ